MHMNTKVELRISETSISKLKEPTLQTRISKPNL